MRNLFFSFIFIVIFCTQIASSINAGVESKYIRNLYLIELGVPPTPQELEWILVYEQNSIKSAVDYILDFKYGKENFAYKNELRYLYQSEKKQESEKFLVPKEVKANIIKYQAGNLNYSLIESKDILIKNAITTDYSSQDGIDYLFICLCGRPTNTFEANMLEKIHKKFNLNDYDKFSLIFDMITEMDAFIYF
jgi:hypothetical protein